MNQTLSVLFIVTALTVAAARAETWPQAPGLSSPTPAGATDLKPVTPPPPTTTEKITTLTTSDPQKAPTTPTPPPPTPPPTPPTPPPSPPPPPHDSPPPSNSAPSSPLFPAPSAPPL